ncbi:MAG: MFS transporter [Spirochaetes bacterium]|nr:MFS transporter [Spirochaetota bacterium]MBU1079765.1 MFS transporter [Spirochaetota bacterium]
MPRTISLKELVKKNGSMATMLLVVIFVGMGEKMAERFLPLYLIALGGSTWAVGFLNSMDNLLSALYSFPGGYLSDRIGFKKSLQLFTAVAMFGYLLVILVPAWQAVLVGSVFFIAWTAVSLPAIMSMVSKVVPKERRALGVSVHSFTKRIPMALGPIAGGAIIGAFGRVDGVRIAFGAAFVMGLVALILMQRFMADDVVEKADLDRRKATRTRDLFSPALRSLLASDILIRFAEQIPYAFVVIWAVDNNRLTALQFGLLTTIEMVTAMLVYIPVAWMSDRYGKKPFVLITFGFFTAFPLVLLFSRSFPMFVVAFIIRGLKEFGEPTRKALIMDLAPEEAKARTFGAYYLIRDVIVAIAALSSAWLWNISPAANFITAACFGVVGSALFAVFGRDVRKAA